MINPDKVYILVSKKIVDLRRKKGITQENLALEAGLNRAYIGYIERGERKPTLRTLTKIANALKVKFHELFYF